MRSSVHMRVSPRTDAHVDAIPPVLPKTGAPLTSKGVCPDRGGASDPDGGRGKNAVFTDIKSPVIEIFRTIDYDNSTPFIASTHFTASVWSTSLPTVAWAARSSMAAWAISGALACTS